MRITTHRQRADAVARAVPRHLHRVVGPLGVIERSADVHEDVYGHLLEHVLRGMEHQEERQSG